MPCADATEGEKTKQPYAIVMKDGSFTSLPSSLLLSALPISCEQLLRFACDLQGTGYASSWSSWLALLWYQLMTGLCVLL